MMGRDIAEFEVCMYTYVRPGLRGWVCLCRCICGQPIWETEVAYPHMKNFIVMDLHDDTSLVPAKH